MDLPPGGPISLPPLRWGARPDSKKNNNLFDDKRDLLQSMNSIMQTYNYTPIILNIYLRVL